MSILYLFNIFDYSYFGCVTWLQSANLFPELTTEEVSWSVIPGILCTGRGLFNAFSE